MAKKSKNVSSELDFVITHETEETTIVEVEEKFTVETLFEGDDDEFLVIRFKHAEDTLELGYLDMANGEWHQTDVNDGDNLMDMLGITDCDDCC